MIKALEYLFLMSALFLLLGCSKEPEVIKIGVVLNLSGKASSEGFECRNGYRLAIDEINYKYGGINGHRIELVVKDNCGIKENSQKVTLELVNSGIKYILGYIASHECWAALQKVNKNNVLLISPSVTGEKFFGMDDNLITCLAHNKYQSSLLSKAAFDCVGNGVFTLICDRNKEEFSLSLINQFKNYLNAYGVERIYVHSLDNTNAKSLDSIILMLKKEKPQALMVALSAVDLAMVIQIAKKINPKIKVFSPMWGQQPLLIEHGGNAINEGVYFAGVFDLHNREKDYLEFRENYKSKFKLEPTAFSMLGYESAFILREAFLNVGFDSPRKVKSYICSIRNYVGLQSRFSFNRFGDPDREYRLFTIKNKSYIAVENAKIN